MTPKTICLEFCTLEFHESYAICTINEGETICIEKMNTVAIEGDKYYGSRPFVYITHRKFSYAVDPEIYKYISMLENLIGFAVVSKSAISIESARLEERFIKKTFSIFKDLVEAENWAHKLIEDYNANLNLK